MRAPVLFRVRNTPKTCPLTEKQHSFDLLIPILSARASVRLQIHSLTFLVRHFALHVFNHTYRPAFYKQQYQFRGDSVFIAPPFIWQRGSINTQPIGLSGFVLPGSPGSRGFGAPGSRPSPKWGLLPVACVSKAVTCPLSEMLPEHLLHAGRC